MNTGEMKATELLAGLLVSTRGDVGGTPLPIEGGIGMEVVLESGDRYLVVVKWLGDRESEV